MADNSTRAQPSYRYDPCGKQVADYLVNVAAEFFGAFKIHGEISAAE